MKTSYYSHGKLLLSGEYAVLDGARALALPTRLGQWLEVSEKGGNTLSWTSLDADGTPWLQGQFEPEALARPPKPGPFPADPQERLLQILQTAASLQPDFLQHCTGKQVKTRLEFPRSWGLGSSSTLLANLAAWAGCDPYALLDRTLGGSGYDLACAAFDHPIFYRRIIPHPPVVEAAPFDPPFAESLWFIYLNVKQDSREGISRYRNLKSVPGTVLAEISDLGARMAASATLPAFCEALDRHEALLSRLLGLPTVKMRLFPDYPGSLKSLGAWGGDFILAAGDADTPRYFLEKGYPTRLAYRELIA